MKKKINYQIFFFVVPQLIYLVYIIIGGKLKFSTNDDIVIVDILSGRCGGMSPYISGVSVIFGYISNFLYGFLPYTNWIPIIYLCVICIGFLFIDITMIQKNLEKSEILIRAVVVFLIFYLIVNHFTFTVAAYTGIIGGMIYIINNLMNGKHLFIKENFGSFLIILIGIMIRTSAIQSLIIIMAPYALYELIRNRKKELIVFCFICYGLMLVQNKINDYAYSQSEVEDSYRKWNSARASVTDYTSLDKINNTLNWSENDYQALYQAFLYDREFFSTENLNKLQTESKLSRYYTNLKNIFIKQYGIFDISKMLENGYNHFIKLFIIISILGIIIDRKKWLNITLIMLGAFSTSILFFIMGRNVYRVLMPGYVFGTLLILMITELKIINLKTTGKVATVSILLSTLLLLLVTEYKNEEILSGVYDVKNRQILRYVEENDNILYLPCDTNIFALGLADPLFKYNKTKKNIIGNWDIYSQAYYNLLDSFQIKNPDRLILDIPNNDSLQLITLQGNEVPDFVLNFIEDRNGFKVETKIMHSIKNTGYGEVSFYSIQKK